MSPWFRRSVVALGLFVLAAGMPGLAGADDGRVVVKQLIRATAQVKPDPNSWGTGWVADRARKLVVTNYHVVGNADTVNLIFPVYKNGRLLSNRDDYKGSLGLPGRVVDTDTERDLAVIQLELLPEGTVELQLAAESASPGDRIRSVGIPGASEGMWVATEGSVRSVYKKQWAYTVGTATQECKAYVVETQSPTNSGDSGGPMVDDQGQLVAVVSGGRAWYNGKPVEAMNWGIDVREVKDFLDQSRRLLDPKTAADYALRGERLIKRGRYAQASEDLTTALGLDPRCAAAYRNRGRILLLHKGDNETALADLTRAIELDAGDSVAHFYRALAYDRKGKDTLEKSLADYTRAIQLNPKYALAYNNRGWAQQRRGEARAALDDYGRAIEADPSFTIAYKNRASLYRDAKEYQKALADYEQAVRLSPSAQNVALVALLHNDLGQHAEAVKLCDLALEKVDPKYAFAWRQRAYAFERLKQYPEALRSYTQALQHGDNKYWWTYYHRGLCFEAADNDACSKDYAEAIKLNPKVADELKEFKRTYLKIVNRRDEAVKVSLYYETTSKGEWTWFPEAPPDGKPLTVEVGPNQVVYVLDGEFKVKGRRIRIWAESASGFRDTTFKDKDAWLCPQEGYRAHRELSILYIVGNK